MSKRIVVTKNYRTKYGVIKVTIFKGKKELDKLFSTAQCSRCHSFAVFKVNRAKSLWLNYCKECFISYKKEIFENNSTIRVRLV